MVIPSYYYLFLLFIFFAKFNCSTSINPLPASSPNNIVEDPFSVTSEIDQKFQACKEVGVIPIVICEGFNETLILDSITLNEITLCSGVFFKAKGSNLEILNVEQLKSLGIQLQPSLKAKISVNNAHFEAHELHTSEFYLGPPSSMTMRKTNNNFIEYSTPKTRWFLLGCPKMETNPKHASKLHKIITKFLFHLEKRVFPTDKLLKTFGYQLGFDIMKYTISYFKSKFIFGAILLVILCLGLLYNPSFVQALLGGATLFTTLFYIFSILKSLRRNKQLWLFVGAGSILLLCYVLGTSGSSFPPSTLPPTGKALPTTNDDLDNPFNKLGIHPILVYGPNCGARKWKSLTINGVPLAGAVFLKTNGSSLDRLYNHEIESLGILLPKSLEDSIDATWNHFEAVRSKSRSDASSNSEHGSLGIQLPKILNDLAQGKLHIAKPYDDSIPPITLRKMDDNCFQVFTPKGEWTILQCGTKESTPKSTSKYHEYITRDSLSLVGNGIYYAIKILKFIGWKFDINNYLNDPSNSTYHLNIFISVMIQVSLILFGFGLLDTSSTTSIIDGVGKIYGASQLLFKILLTLPLPYRLVFLGVIVSIAFLCSRCFFRRS